MAMRYDRVSAPAKQLKQKALEPQKRFCRNICSPVTILIEYQDYKSPCSKGECGTIYCENIVDCYQNSRECRYSGISPLYADPLITIRDAITEGLLDADWEDKTG
jgi:hypothetical protein